MCLDFIYLASGSPRRRELLQQIGVPFRVVGATVDEAVLTGVVRFVDDAHGPASQRLEQHNGMLQLHCLLK